MISLGKWRNTKEEPVAYSGGLGKSPTECTAWETVQRGSVPHGEAPAWLCDLEQATYLCEPLFPYLQSGEDVRTHLGSLVLRVQWLKPWASYRRMASMLNTRSVIVHFNCLLECKHQIKNCFLDTAHCSIPRTRTEPGNKYLPKNTCWENGVKRLHTV